MKDIIIVGAGIAGLSAGIYAVQSGFEVTIYESHTIPGGASTSWRRNGYLFEGGMHWLTGSSPKTLINKCWREVRALDDSVEIHNKEIFLTVEYEGITINLYTDLNKLSKHLLEIAPEDEKEILRLIKDIKSFSNFEMPITDLKGLKVKNKSSMSIGKAFSMIPALPRMSFYINQSSKEYSNRFKNKGLQLLFKSIVGEENNAMSLIFTIATVTSGDGGYPKGGSLEMAKRMEMYFKSLGGKIEYKSKVERVLVKDNTAYGVIVKGEEINSDAVIVTVDTLTAIDKLFEEAIKEPWAEKMRRDTKPMLNTFICLGIKEELEGISENTLFFSKQPLIHANKEINTLGLHNYYGYKGYAPEGCTAVTSAIMDDTYDFWKNAQENGTYEGEKQKLAENFINILAEKYPQIKGKVEVWDVATPLTYERYLGSYKGSWMSIMGKGEKTETYQTKPESIKNVYFAGQRMSLPGGLPVALETGRKAVQYLCKDNDVMFQKNI